MHKGHRAFANTAQILGESSLLRDDCCVLRKYYILKNSLAEHAGPSGIRSAFPIDFHHALDAVPNRVLGRRNSGQSSRLNSQLPG